MTSTNEVMHFFILIIGACMKKVAKKCIFIFIIFLFFLFYSFDQDLRFDNFIEFDNEKCLVEINNQKYYFDNTIIHIIYYILFNYDDLPSQ